MVGYSTSGVVITVVPLLSLAALEAMDPTVLAYNIDSIRNGDVKCRLQVALCLLPKNTTKTVFLFASPQTLTLDPSWFHTFEQLIKNGNIKLMAVDKCHLYANFGITFRS
jgi:superfamily II DNA helicase RecQ